MTPRIMFAACISLGLVACSGKPDSSASSSGTMAAESSSEKASPPNRCMQAAQQALTHAHAALGSPSGTDATSLERIVQGARDEMRNAVSGDPDAVVSTSVLGDRIKIWVNCDGEEQTRDWHPG